MEKKKEDSVWYRRSKQVDSQVWQETWQTVELPEKRFVDRYSWTGKLTYYHVLFFGKL